jgi:diguanylate cyclase (GGDEF)-like protein/PAS domain S-box-containing protein
MYLDNFQVKVKWQVPLAFLVLLVPTAGFNTHLFHDLVEGFAIVVAILTYVVASNSYRFSQSHFLMFLGCGYFWVGILDFLHTISFLNPSIFPNADSGTTIQFWIIARFFEAITLLCFTSFINKKINTLWLFWGMGSVFFIMLFMVVQDSFPSLYSEENGLTTTKVVAEYLIIAILLVAAKRVWDCRSQFNHSIYKLLMLSIGLTILAEVTFTLYSSLSGLTIVLGHVFKLMSFWAIYVALVESTLKQPFKALTLSSDTFNALPDAITTVNQNGVILQANDSARAFYQGEGRIEGQHVHGVFHSRQIPVEQCPICRSIERKHPIHFQEIQLFDKWNAITLSAISHQQQSNVVLHVSRDISDHKQTTTQYQTMNRLYTVLRLTNKAIINSKTKEELLKSICHIAVKYGGFSMTWIGMIEGDDVVPVSSAGDSRFYLKGINIRVDDSDYARGPVGVCAKTGEVAFVNDITKDEAFSPWRRPAIKCGFKSLAVIPVKQNQLTIGVFSIYASEINAFDTQILELLVSLSDDISSVISHVQSEEKRVIAEGKLKQLYLAIEQSKSAIAISDVKGNIDYINPYYTELTGYSESEVLRQNVERFSRSLVADQKILQQCWYRVLSGKDWQGEVMCLKKNGEPFWALLSVSPIFDNSEHITHIVWTSKDNTELHDAHETISQLAYYDALTGLPNRRLYQDRFQLAISAAKRHKSKLGLLYLDVDNFKGVNDVWGHDFGDQLLKYMASVLMDCVREMDTVARLGGDEFCIIINDVNDNADLVHIADNILNRLNRTVELDGRDMSINTSIGISVYPDDAMDAGELMKCADMAMYHAKDKGKNNFQFFEEFLNINAQHRLNRERKIKQALVNNDFQLYYQPQFNLISGELIGVEALIRWVDEGKVLLPGEFITICEESSLINELGEWVVNQACHEYKDLLDCGFPAVKVAINISAGQFHQSNVLLDIINEALLSSGLPGHLLQLELTESVLMVDVPQTIEVIEQLKQKSITFAIDDFGTGYSSLSYLKNFPADIIKIDRSFVGDIESDINDRAIISAITMMSHELGLKVLAEGVENEAQLAFLKELKCDFVQGFFYAKPMPGPELLTAYGIKS